METESSPAKVTFIMPAYNAGDYIAGAIESVITQNVPYWELIIVDDHSSDSTLEIAGRYAAEDPRIRVISLGEQSGGAYSPRKRAIMEASTAIVAPLDADDAIDPDYLDNLLNVMEQEDAEIVYPVMHLWDGKNEIPGFDPDQSLIGQTLGGKDAVKYSLNGWRIHCNGGILKRDLYIRSFDLMDEGDVTVKSYLDEYFTRILLYNATKVTLTSQRYLYRIAPRSVTHSKDVRAFGFLENNLRLISFVEERYGAGSEEQTLVQMQAFYGLLHAMRLMRKCILGSEEAVWLNGLMKESRERLDREVLKGNVRQHHRLLMRLPFWLSRHVLGIVDTLRGKA